MKKNISVEFKVGIFSLIGLILFVSLGIHFSRSAGEVKGKEYYVLFDFLNGLQEGAAIRYSGGILIGKVLSIEPYESRAKLHVVVSNRIKVDSKTEFSIMSNGLLGEKYVNLSLGSPTQIPNEPPATELKEGSVIEGKVDAGLDKLMSGVTELADKMSKVMVPLAQIITKLDQTNELPRLISSLRELVGQGVDLIQTNRLKISNILSSIQSIMNKIDKGQGALGKILNDPVFARSLGDVLDSIDTLVSKISNNPLINSGQKNTRNRGMSQY